MRESERFAASGAPVLVVRLEDGRVLQCAKPFFIGRDAECEVRIQDAHASRRHAQVIFERGEWSIRDLRSSNGLFVGGEPVESAPIGRGISVTLGSDGPLLRIEPETAARHPDVTPRAGERASTSDPGTLKDVADRYFGATNESSAGGHTLMIRKAFQQLQAQQKRRHRWIVGVLTVLVLCMAAYAVYQHQRLSRQDAKARDLFYTIKSQELEIDSIEQELAKTANPTSLAKLRNDRRQTEEEYNRYVSELYDRRLIRKDRLILKVTRTFGECEIAAPAGYIDKVKEYIEKWRSGNRFKTAVKRAQDSGYVKTIVDEFTANGLPPQFFYLGMQESDFKPNAIGTPTRWGIAKGMWQFIPETGEKYGLAIGPLKAAPQYDAADARFDWRQATRAAARYVKKIYDTKAQASGLLVIASYNWGEHRVIDMLDKMPENPKERNFWKLQEKYGNRIPQQTYDYVFYIVSAAVIGEDPVEFGFDLANPLQPVAQNPPGS